MSLDKIFKTMYYFDKNIKLFTIKDLKRAYKELRDMEINHALTPNLWYQLVMLKKAIKEQLDKDITELLEEFL